MITPTLGRVVLYCLSEQDAEAINRRRTTGGAISSRIQTGEWPLGAQAHIGNAVKEGDVFPALIVRTWSEDLINIKVMLDGSDDYWATSRHVSDGAQPGFYHWMPYQVGQAARTEAAEAKLAESAASAVSFGAQLGEGTNEA